MVGVLANSVVTVFIRCAQVTTIGGLYMIEHQWGPLLALNQAHVIMQEEVGLLSTTDASAILEVLDELTELDPDEIADCGQHPYTYLEHTVIEAVGPVIGGKLHTGRSKNDLMTAVLQLIVRDHLGTVIGRVCTFRDQLLDLAGETTDVVMPAYTHNQPAQPITVAHYVLGFDHLLERDVDRLRRAFVTTNQSPLGAAAIGGTGFGIDRERLAELAGFADIRYNTYDAVASMDFVMEAANALAVLRTNLTRLTADLLNWVTYQYAYATLDEAQFGASSIMPQKRNPGTLESIRASGSEGIAGAASAMIHFKGIPFGDVGDRRAAAKLSLVDQHAEVCRRIDQLSDVIVSLSFDDARLLADANASFCTMTELADTLVREAGVSFRQAHGIASRLTDDMTTAGRTAADITTADVIDAATAELGEPIAISDAAVEAALDPRQNVTRRETTGGTAPTQTIRDLERQRTQLADQREWLEGIRQHITEADRTRGVQIDRICRA